MAAKSLAQIMVETVFIPLPARDWKTVDLPVSKNLHFLFNVRHYETLGDLNGKLYGELFVKSSINQKLVRELFEILKPITSIDGFRTLEFQISIAKQKRIEQVKSKEIPVNNSQKIDVAKFVKQKVHFTDTTLETVKTSSESDSENKRNISDQVEISKFKEIQSKHTQNASTSDSGNVNKTHSEINLATPIKKIFSTAQIMTEPVFIPISALNWKTVNLPVSKHLHTLFTVRRYEYLRDLHGKKYGELFVKSSANQELIRELFEVLKPITSTEGFKVLESQMCSSKEQSITSKESEKIVPVVNNQKNDISNVFSETDSEISEQEIIHSSEELLVVEDITEKTVSENIENQFSDDDWIGSSSIEEVIDIPIEYQDISILQFPLSVRLDNVLHRLGIEHLGDLHQRTFSEIKHTKNCGQKTIDELFELVEKLHTAEADNYLLEIKNPEAKIEKVNIPLAVRDLPINFLVDSTELKILLYSLGAKTLGDLHDIEVAQIKKNRNADDDIFSKFKSLVEKAQNGEFDNYLLETQIDSFKSKLLTRLCRQITIPDDIRDVSIKLVSFTSRLRNLLQRLNIETLGNLEKFTFDNLKSMQGVGKDSVFELWQFTARMQKSVDEGKDLRAEPDFNFPAENTFAELSINGLLDFLNKFLAELPEREREVLIYRFGGAPDGKIPTLGELGEKFQVTRERIRQIESNNLKKLKSLLSGISENALEKIKYSSVNAVCPVTARFLIHLTENDYELFEYPPNFYLHLLKEISPEIFIFTGNLNSVQSNKNTAQISKKIKGLLDERAEFLTLSEVFDELSNYGTNHNLVINDFFEAIQDKNFIIENGDTPDVLLIATDKNNLTMVEMARQVLLQSERPLTPEEILEEAKKIFGAETELHSGRSLANLPSYDSCFYLLDRRTIGLRQHFRLPEERWNEVKTDFYNLLLEQQRPISTTDVISKNFFDWTAHTTPSETTEILREDERFRDLGRFLFALADWEIEEREPIKDLVVKVLQESEIPLTATEIGENIQKYRSVSTTSMPTILRRHTEIQEFDFGYFGLKSKGDYRNFFATDEKFLKRLIKKSSPVIFNDLCRKLDLHVDEELAQKMWRALRSFDKLRFEPVYRSAETVITFRA